MSSVLQWSILTPPPPSPPPPPPPLPPLVTLFPPASKKWIRGGELYLSLSLTCPPKSVSLCLMNSSTWRCDRRRERQTSRTAEEGFFGEEEEEEEEESAAEEEEAREVAPSSPSPGVQQLRQSTSKAPLLLPLPLALASERAEASASHVEQSGSTKLVFFFVVESDRIGERRKRKKERKKESVGQLSEEHQVEPSLLWQ